jgi:hypothetical protein
VALLAAKTLGLGHGDARHADFVKRFLHFVQLERLDDRLDLFTPETSSLAGRKGRRSAQFASARTQGPDLIRLTLVTIYQDLCQSRLGWIGQNKPEENL